MRPAVWLILVIAAACSQPERRRKPKPDTVFVGTLGDRDHPTEISIDDTLGQARATAPGAGTWWYVVRVKPWPDVTTQLTITARHVTTVVRSAADRVRVDVIDGGREIAGVTSNPRESQVVLDARPDPLEPVLVRVTTTGKARFWLTAMRKSKFIPQPPRPPPCDRHHMDPSNPNCAGVSPHCNLDDPDFTNPDCCQADCEFGALRCRAKVVSGGATAANIAIGKSRHLMRFATGRLYQRGNLVSDVLVLQVDEDESFVKIMSPQAVDIATLFTHGEVVLGAPEQCKRR